MPACRKIFKRFGRDQQGAAAIEFAAVAPVFIALLLSMIEMGVAMTKIALLDNAVAQSSKFIYTGAATTGSPSQEEIEDFICKRAVLFTDCKKNITVEVTPVDDLTGASAGAVQCTDSENDSEIKPSVAYTPGSGSQIAMLRVCITSKVFTPGLRYGLGIALKDTDTGRAEYVSMLAFMNEPF